jgi:hypothetical protein
MKKILGAFLAAAMAFGGGAALAADRAVPGQGGRQGGASADALRQFQKETLTLRDELSAKRLELENEYDKAEPDAARVVSLRKEIVDLEGRIQAAADKQGIAGWGRGHGNRMARGSYGWDGCGCGHCW